METIKVPDIGNTSDISVIEVFIKPGDNIQRDDSMITLESDKASMEIPTPISGIVKIVHIKVGDQVSSGTPIADVERSEASMPEPSDNVVDQASKKSTTDTENNTAANNLSPDNTVIKDHPSATSNAFLANENVDPVADNKVTDIHAGPAVRKLARELGVNLAAIKGSGPNQRILKEDLYQFVKSSINNQAFQSTSPLSSATTPVIDFSQFGKTDTIPLSRIQQLTAKNLHSSWINIPHVTHFFEADITELDTFRKQQKTDENNLTLLPFIIKSACHGLKKLPQFNASLAADNEQLILKKYCHIGIAVSTPEGLLVPVVHNADKKSIIELAQEINTLIEQARNKRLLPNQLQGACFTITSLGALGGTGFTPIINPPEVAILGISQIQIKPIYYENEFIPRKLLPLSLSYDHRVINGVDAALLSQLISQQLTDIRQLLL